MSKTSTRAKLECLKIWLEDRKIKPKKKKQPNWLKELYEDED
jgi:hypothetical protein